MDSKRFRDPELRRGGCFAQRARLPAPRVSDTGARRRSWGGAQSAGSALVACTRWLVGVAVLAIAARAQAQESTEIQQIPRPAEVVAGEGAFLPQTLPARVGSTQGFALGSGGYDSSRGGPLIDSAVEASVWGPLALRVQATYSNDTKKMRPSVGGRAQLLRQERHGIDAAIAVFYKTEGFTEAEGEIETFASVGRRFEHFSLLGNLVYGQDPEGNERDGEVRAAIWHQARALVLGLDTRARFALGAQHGRAATTEPSFDFLAGPGATLVTGPVALFAQCGPSVFRLSGGPTRAGAAALAGVGAAF
jgi:hypothetical protein